MQHDLSKEYRMSEEVRERRHHDIVCHDCICKLPTHTLVVELLEIGAVDRDCRKRVDDEGTADAEVHQKRLVEGGDVHEFFDQIPVALIIERGEQ